jgi:DNA-binding transcriptional LysR family regulator
MNLRNIELRRIQQVAVLARVGSFVGAAEELHITQSALTRSIQSIEREFSLRLFDRDRSGVALTAIGREFLRRAQPLLTEADDIARYLRRAGRGEDGEVSFGLSTLPAKLFLSQLTLDLIAAKPSLRASVAVRDPNELMELLLTNKLEFFIAAMIPEQQSAKVEINELATVPTTLAVRAGHPLLRKKSVSSNDLSKYPILVTNFEPGQRAPKNFFVDHPATIKCDEYAVLLKVTLRSDAIWVTSMPSTGWEGIDENLRPLPLNTEIYQQVNTLKSVKLARRTLSPLAAEVLADIRRRCAEIQPESQA